MHMHTYAYMQAPADTHVGTYIKKNCIALDKDLYEEQDQQNSTTNIIQATLRSTLHEV